MRKAELLARKAAFWPIPDFKERIFDYCEFPTQGSLHFCIRCSLPWEVAVERPRSKTQGYKKVYLH